ncbi:CBL-interacting protein kinase 1-like isoform X2 [Phalaenopsis equestris]|uniref:CBL-interacting protein kinase 1-like isoform X2 n=1 Tax=Phalaenopsis equestris TaxID=78828 RepID=UPI0009E65423|nr:CBL-interacting protein kinase 1-like isoform X2 [Phalaenopsis equestris]
MKNGKYKLGRTLGEGNFGKVKFATRVDTGEPFAVKILDRKRILDLKIHEQIKREIATLKLLKHPNVVRLHEVSASKTRIYMVLEYVNGGELFDKIATGGRLSEEIGRKLFQQLIDGISYCHDRGVYHRDLKPENVLIDAIGNIKISDFGLSALSQHLWNDGLLHTTCGSPNYIAPEVLANRGYDGAMSDIWSCGVILYIILIGALPFDDRNLAVLYQKIIKGDTQIPKCISIGAQNILRRILDPNPKTRIDVAQIKEDAWFKQDYNPATPYDDDNIYPEDETLSLSNGVDECENTPTLINAFELIGMSSCLDLSGFFEKEDITERKIRFTSNCSPKNLFDKIDEIIAEMGFQVQSANRKSMILPKTRVFTASRSPSSLSVAAEIFELSPTLYVVELRKAYGDSSLYRELCSKISNDLGLFKSESLSNNPALLS